MRGDKRKKQTLNTPIPCEKLTHSPLKEVIPFVLENRASKDYALLDSGEGRKLERHGTRLINRPAARALWRREFGDEIWEKVDATFIGDTDRDGAGSWQFSRHRLTESWPLSWYGKKGRLDFYGRFTSFHHIGVFPEQAAHWEFMEEQIIASPNKINLLNLFGYTGIASLIAARSGACVTHVDASKKAIGWARQNQELANLREKPIRWICDDAIKFCEREIRRRNFYNAIILDPPKFGHGPKGELWQLFRNLPYMMELCRKLLSNNPLFVILTSYSIHASFYDIHELMRDTFGDFGGNLQSGELIIRGENSKRAFSTSLFSRWNR